MTKPVNIRVLNAQGVSERNPAEEITAGIVRPSAHGGPVDIWLLSEVAWADLEGIAARHRLHALHYGDRGSAEAGVGVLSRRPISRPSLLQAVASTREGGGIRMRPIASGRTFGLAVSAVHAHPARAPIAQRAYMARVRVTGGLVGGDFNVRPREMRNRFARRYRGVGVLGLLVPRRLRVSEARGVDVGSDHPAVDVQVWRGDQ